MQRESGESTERRKKSEQDLLQYECNCDFHGGREKLLINQSVYNFSGKRSSGGHENLSRVPIQKSRGDDYANFHLIGWWVSTVSDEEGIIQDGECRLAQQLAHWLHYNIVKIGSFGIRKGKGTGWMREWVIDYILLTNWTVSVAVRREGGLPEMQCVNVLLISMQIYAI